ncbi:hypothetical protein P3342_012485 [Pyrenophora teres f. teres]|uniref:DUF572-domain-containing protein n=1 Tax=Pyrenophora teres f. teres (strain 0-1) TaxID=861557 RepID=E3S451_PYRTT|nr:hypothetical protein PTT_17305 [Pyrenophora teres f. teres 0-1]KAE8823876.1 hypothetical protein HRS9139_09058 [Pyrenophora teres f. teres]KAE8825155.1 hypothetical protein HRS9122_10254 [Pyrenophora teres f. teres]KAE8854925.1 hypothetical protein PTNB29_09176 [Pyrenophora teres f. teres]KAK1912002.1 hypothetical protein P3342_012485 [Pyrenophora teres f. teres]
MQGFNMGRYYPPDASNPPTFNTTSHPLGARARKLTQGILTVRFELPFAVWCNTCKPPAIIGQGVRFNAEKKKVGNYYSTPIWSFRMKHSACGGWWEIRTDPQKSEYVVFEGARRREYGRGDEGEEGEGGEMKFLTEEEREKRREDAFAGFEGKVEEKGVERGLKERVEELYDKSEVWRDPYDVNAKLRGEFRKNRKVWKKEERVKEGMQEKFSLGLDIVDETEGDRARAALVEFGGDASGNTEHEAPSWKPLFEDTKTPDTATKALEPAAKTKKLKAEAKAEESRLGLQQTLITNTKAAVDPFLLKDGGGARKRVNLGILKRKREAATQDAGPLVTPSVAKTEDEGSKKKMALMKALVAYDSD